MFEDSKWIACPKIKNEHGSFLFRKQFKCDKKIKSATLAVCGLGYGEYTINGKKVTDDVLTTPFTRFDRRVIYLTYDVTELVVQGSNTIGVFLGNGWYNDIGAAWNLEKATWRHHPKMILELKIEREDGEIIKINSDTTWKCCEGPITYNHVREGEIYDARLEQKLWNTNEFSDDSWENAVICPGPGGILEPMDMPPIRVVRTLNMTYLGNNVYDTGENISGWAKIKVKGKQGSVVELHYCEILTENGDIDNSHICKFISGDLKYCDKYILSGDGVEEWEPRFVYHGFRYVKVVNAPEDFEICARVVHTDLEIIGDFECSDDMLNKIHQAARRSTLTNFHSIPTDCPHREQLGWTADAHISAEQALMNYDMLKSYRKWLEDFKDVQRPSGQLPGIIPTSNWGYNWGNGPGWDSAIILIPWYVYEITQNASLICQMWDNMKLYMEYMKSMSEDYIVDFGLGDWNSPKNAKICPSAVTGTAYYYSNAKIMAKCAVMMNEDAAYYEDLAEKIKISFREKFLNRPELEKSQTFIACCIYQGLYNPEEIPEKAAKLAELVGDNDYRIDCGILGTKYIFSALADNGYSNVLYKMVTNPKMPSYAYWINNGMTTFCSSWDMTASRNHHMFSEVDMWLYKHIAGIKIKGGEITIRPCFIDEVKWVKAKHRDISVYYDMEKITVVVPKKCDVVLGNQVYKVEAGVHTFKIRR